MSKAPKKLIGPFSQLITMSQTTATGALKDSDLDILTDAGMLIHQGQVETIGPFEELAKDFSGPIEEISTPVVATPGFIDTHTHMCFAGSRARDYALRVAGASYLDIAKSGGGILDTVKKTREASLAELKNNLLQNTQHQIANGITTCEVKSGYGLSVADEIKMLTAIQETTTPLELVPTCLAAHTLPPEFTDHKEYLNHIQNDLLPRVYKENLARRVDIFIEDGAFDPQVSLPYLQAAQDMGFSLVIHADQFSTGGSQLACDVKALSADHLEASTDKDITNLAKAGVIATVLPGASLGLGMPYAPARKLLDAGCCVVIASDWNPGSAPMGNLLLQACVLGAAEKLTLAETLAAITCRAALALELTDRGSLESGKRADFVCFNTKDYRDIFYHQGSLKPQQVWRQGERLL